MRRSTAIPRLLRLTAKPRRARRFLKNLNIERVFVCGLALDYCVKFGVLDALQAGFETIVIPDACAAIAVGHEADILNEMRTKGARIMTASEVATRAS